MADTISEALDRVMTRFGRMLRSVGRRRGLGEAELDELAQEVRVRLWRALSDRETIDQARTSYVYRAALSAAVDMVRRRRMRTDESLDSGHGGRMELVRPAQESPDSAMEQRELGEQIHRAINSLAEPRDVVVRLHLTGYDRYEIAELLGWTEPKVRNLIYRGLADLRAQLIREGVGPRSTV